jgi:DNA-binding transcriptional LysR family regulator
VQPNRLHYFFAHDWPLRIWLAAFAAAFAAGAVRLGLGVAIVAVVALMGLLIGFLFALVVLPPLYRRRARVNGAPFRKGDTIRVLRGPHRGAVARV